MMIDNVSHFPLQPRAVRPAPTPLGLYLRVGRNDHRELSNYLASGDSGYFGVVIDPTSVKRHRELHSQILDRKLDSIIDPRTQASATAGGFTHALGTLPWGLDRAHVTDDFEGRSGQRIIGKLAEFVLEHGFTQVLAPTHLISSSADPWFKIDLNSCRQLRINLDRIGGSNVPIIYSLAVPYAVLRDQEQRRYIIEACADIPTTAIWLKVDGFGADATPTATLSYMDAATDFGELNMPVIADHVGGVVGLSLLAFGATGGLVHGVTLGQRFDAANWRKLGSSGGSQQRRVYVPGIDAMLVRNDAKLLINSSIKARATFGCSDTNCCPRGVKDMLENPVRHFLYQRTKEISALSQVPDNLRAQHFLDVHLRPATDKAVAATNINWEDETMAKRMREKRKRLDALRIALGRRAEVTTRQLGTVLPETRAVREARW